MAINAQTVTAVIALIKEVEDSGVIPETLQGVEDLIKHTVSIFQSAKTSAPHVVEAQSAALEQAIVTHGSEPVEALAPAAPAPEAEAPKTEGPKAE